MKEIPDSIVPFDPDQKKIVLVFDICSSVNILEKLYRNQDIKPFTRLIVALNRWLKNKEKSFSVTQYKFTGDGWILLFDNDFDGNKLLSFIEELSLHFEDLFSNIVKKHLRRPLPKIGLTFGLAVGKLFKIVMEEHDEYIGRPIYLACRLQAATKELTTPMYHILVRDMDYLRILFKQERFYEYKSRIKLKGIYDYGAQLVAIDILTKKPPSKSLKEELMSSE